MRIVGGVFGGRRLRGLPAGAATRPSSERLREGLASALSARDLLADARVLDLFAGCGALGFEALSRGAASLVAVDRAEPAIRCLRENARSLELGQAFVALRLDLLRTADRNRLSRFADDPFELVLCDPPYAMSEQAAGLVAHLQRAGVLAPGCHVALEHDAALAPDPPAGLETVARYRYGGSAVSLWGPAR